MDTIEDINNLIERLKDNRIWSTEKASFLDGILVNDFLYSDFINFLEDLKDEIKTLNSFRDIAIKYTNSSSENLVMAMLAGGKLQKESQNKEASQEDKS